MRIFISTVASSLFMLLLMMITPADNPSRVLVMMGVTMSEGIEKVTSMLAFSFDTTLVALVLSIFLMLLIHAMHKQQDELMSGLRNYVIENLINRFYK